MTGHDHWLEAEVLITEKACDYGCPHAGCVHEMAYIARAQVHATLAAAVVDGPAVMRPEDRDVWDRATGRLEEDQ
jgi:hypothetical protein